MSDHCAYPKCKKELVHTEGRRKKKYCDQNCNTRHWQMLHPKHKGKTKRITIEALIEMELAQKKLALMMENPMGILGGVGQRIDIEDLKKDLPDQTPSAPSTENNSVDKISEYEKELETLVGKNSSIANQRRKWLNGQLLKLKK